LLSVAPGLCPSDNTRTVLQPTLNVHAEETTLSARCLCAFLGPVVESLETSEVVLGIRPDEGGADARRSRVASPGLNRLQSLDTNHEQRLPDKETSLMARKKREYLPVYRTDLLPSNLTASKEARVRELLGAWRKRLFHEPGRFDLHEPDLLVLRLRGQDEVIRTPRNVREFASTQAIAAV